MGNELVCGRSIKLFKWFEACDGKSRIFCEYDGVRLESAGRDCYRIDGAIGKFMTLEEVCDLIDKGNFGTGGKHE